MKKILLHILISLIGLTGLAVIQPTLVVAAPLPSTSITPSSTATTGQVSIRQELEINAKSSWPWYVSRAAGLVAAGLLVLLMLSGIGQITGITYRIIEPLAAWSLHRALGIALGISILIHGSVLLFNTYTPFTIAQLLVPFLSRYTPVTIWGQHVGSLYVALGILAFYAAALIIITSLFIKDKKPVLWRTLHYTSYLLVVLVFVHGLYLGTDIKSGILRDVWWFSGVIMIIGIVSRLRRSRTLKRKQL